MATSRRPPAFLNYVKDWVAATSHLSPDERGAYHSLLCRAWDGHPSRVRDSEEAAVDLPDDDKELQRITGVGARRWSVAGPRIKSFFETVTVTVKGKKVRFLRSRRLLLEFKAALKRQENARRANAKRRREGKEP